MLTPDLDAALIMPITVRQATQTSRCRGCRLDQMLTCAICDGRYSEPVMLPCQHTFCKRPCMASLVKNPLPENVVQCPRCNNKYPVPEEGLDAYPVNDTITSLLTVSKKEFNQYMNESHEKQRARARGFLPNREEKIADSRRKHYMRQIQKEAEEEKKQQGKVSEEMISNRKNVSQDMNGCDLNKQCLNCGEDITDSDFADDISSVGSSASNISKDSGFDNGDGAKTAQSNAPSSTKSKKSSKKQKQKAKAKAKAAAQSKEEDISDLCTDLVTYPPRDVTSPVSNASAKGARGKEKRTIKVIVDGRPTLMLRCPICHNRAVAEVCLHCKQKVCIPCLEDHMKPIVTTAVQVLKHHRPGEPLPEDCNGGPVMDQGFYIHASESNTEDRYTSLSEPVKAATQKYIAAVNNMCAPGDCSPEKHLKDPKSNESSEKQELVAGSETKLKQDALTAPAIAMLKELFTRDEGMFCDFVTYYMTCQVTPYEAHLIANAILKVKMESFQERAEDELGQGYGRVGFMRLREIQKECQKFSCLFRQLQASKVAPPSIVRIERSLVDTVLEKIRYVRFDKAMFSVTLENHISLIEKLKSCRFVKIYDVEEEQEYRLIKTYKNFKRDETDNAIVDAPEMLHGFDDPLTDPEADQPVYLINGSTQKLQEGITSTSSSAMHRMTAEKLNRLPRLEQFIQPEKVISIKERVHNKKIENEKKHEQMKEQIVASLNWPKYDASISGTVNGNAESTAPTRGVYISPDTKFDDPKVQEAMRHLPEMIEKLDNKASNPAGNDQQASNGTRRSDKLTSSTVVVENDQYHLVQYPIGHFEDGKFIPASDSDEEYDRYGNKKIEKKKEKKAKARKERSKKDSPKHKSQTNTKASDKVPSPARELKPVAVPTSKTVLPPGDKQLVDKEEDPISMSEIWDIIDCVD